ncbi:hypothetical protein EXIGLDRAFT_620227 [Exidia glandulosa HHB12029]|uniref:Uncharacterized protein n=1 Tax=Exidia glandulosa HHB12029 TaxID=1314781 RepID=A0A165EVF6_EXIGL|nr:hypothetical protein EXIGLDRAFT_620227 [Exidia glandulosa HHB12029]
MGAKDWEDEGITFAEEEEYDSTQYFRDRPPPREPAAPRTASTIYQPLPGVIEQNELLLVALSNAHNALWKRYQDYGQMGVFGWTADFSDMIDALKTLGFEGNMFVSTRQAALEACVRILRLRIDIKMQIITIYLCNQVSRLRRFLDADKQWDDYPPIDFPLDPYSEGG